MGLVFVVAEISVDLGVTSTITNVYNLHLFITTSFRDQMLIPVGFMS